MKIFNHTVDVKGAANDLFHLLVLLGGVLGINIENYVTALKPVIAQAQSDLTLIHGLGWAALAAAIFKIAISGNATPIIQDLEKDLDVNPPASPAAPTGPGKAGLFLLGFLLMAGMASAQSFLQYDGGLNISKQTLAQGQTVTGWFASLGVATSFTPETYQNGQFVSGANVGVDLDVVIANGYITASGSLLQEYPGFDLNLLAIEEAVNQGGNQPSLIMPGVGIGIPSLLGNVIPTVAIPVDGKPVEYGITLVTSFDIPGVSLLKL